MASLFLVSGVALIHCVGDSASQSDSPGDAGTTADGTTGSTGDGATMGGDASMTDTDGGDAGTGGSVQLQVLWQSGTPISGAKVRFGSGAPTTTGADGRATYANATATYDLDVQVPGGLARSYRGLSTRTPVVRFTGAGQSAPLNYTLTGTDIDAGTESLRIFATTDECQAGGALLKTPSGTANVVWNGDTAASVKTTFVAMIGTGGPGNLTAVRGKPLIATAMMQPSTAATQTFAYQDQTQGVLSGTIENDGTVGNIEAVMHDPLLPARGVRYVYGTSPSQTSFSIPTYTGTATYDVRISWSSAPNEALYAAIYNLPPTSPSLMLRYTAIPVHVSSPAKGAANITASTMFSWTPAAGVYEVEVDCMNTGYTVLLVLGGTSTQIPDLSAFGVPFPAADSCNWQVSSFPDRTLDDFVGPPGAHAKVLFATQSVASATFTTQ